MPTEERPKTWAYCVTGSRGTMRIDNPQPGRAVADFHLTLTPGVSPVESRDEFRGRAQKLSNQNRWFIIIDENSDPNTAEIPDAVDGQFMVTLTRRGSKKTGTPWLMVTGGLWPDEDKTHQVFISITGQPSTCEGTEIVSTPDEVKPDLDKTLTPDGGLLTGPKTRG